MWTKEKEQCAGSFRLKILWYCYKFTNKIVLKILFFPIYCVIFLFVKNAKKSSKQYREVLRAFCEENNVKFKNFSSFSHIYSYVDSVIDKFDACTLAKNLPNFIINENDDFKFLKSLLEAKNGCFLICSHLGNIEVLPAILTLKKDLPKTKCHAFMRVSQSPIFHKFFSKYFSCKDTTIIPVEDINIETSIEMKESLNKGHLVMMAGDRMSSFKDNENIKISFLGRKVLFPKGVFRFSQMMEVPVFFVICVKEKKNTYKVYFKNANKDFLTRDKVENLACEYANFLEDLVVKYPNQWFHFYDFF